MTQLVTRFAPSPTGFLHIGGARTALFNWLLAKHSGGRFLLRIEDTDRKRSTEAAIEAILDGLSWLGLEWDGEPTYQFSRSARHAEVAHEMVKNGQAYYCYATEEELANLRAEAESKGQHFRYPNLWRDRDPAEAPAGVKPAIRLKTPLEGETVISDRVQGEVRFPNADLDDLILLRSDNTPTYMLAVVVDDHDMGVTLVVRGDDHLSNTPKQALIYRAMGWQTPEFAHIPLIHGPDGAKLSKRHGALGVDAYREMGYLPEALRNYLLRLGWSHGDAEIISTGEAVQWFSLDHVGKSPSRMDFAKMAFVNAHYLKQLSADALLPLVTPFLEKHSGKALGAVSRDRLLRALPTYRDRAETLVQLAEQLLFLLEEYPFALSENGIATLRKEGTDGLNGLAERLAESDWDEAALDSAVKTHVEANALPFKKVGMPLRAVLTGTAQAPALPAIMLALGKEETLRRLRDGLNHDLRKAG